MSTVVSEESWFSRIGGAIKGVLVGLVLSVISVPLLFWNEGRAVYTAKGLAEGAGAVVEAKSDVVDPANEGKFIHLTGTATTPDVLTDSEFGIEFNGIHLQRKAEMYQWVEHKKTKTKKKLGGGTRKTTTYTYDKAWKANHVNSESFHNKSGHQNPSGFKFENHSQHAQNVSLGGFRLPTALVRKISKPEPVAIDPEKISADILDEVVVNDKGAGSEAYWRSEGKYDGTPQVGDMRITFSATPASDVSVMSQQIGETFEPYQTQFGTELHMLRMGTLSSESMIAKAEAENAQLTWILRGVGSAMMFFGFLFILKPLSVLADVVPLFGSIVGAGTGFIAFLLAAAGSLITISIAWVFYRPLIGILLLVVAAGLLGLAFAKTRSKRGYAADEMAAGPQG